MTVHDDLQRVQEALPGADLEAHRALSRVHVEIARLTASVVCGKCGRDCLPDGDCYGCGMDVEHQRAEAAEAEVARLKSVVDLCQDEIGDDQRDITRLESDVARWKSVAAAEAEELERTVADVARLRDGLRQIANLPTPALRAGRSFWTEPQDIARALLADKDGAAQTYTCPCGYPGPEPCNGCPDGCKRRPAGVTGWDHIDKPRGGAA